MTTKIITLTAVSALVAFGAGTYVGRNQESAVPPPVATALDQSQLITSLREHNHQLTATISELNSDVVRLNAVNAELAAKTAVPPPAPAKSAKSLNIGLPVFELQQSMLDNLRQIDSAREQYRNDEGHAAASVSDLVGVGRYIKTVRTVGGEDYSALSMVPGGLLTVTTPDGVTVTYDPSGALTTHPDIPPVLRVRELGQKLQEPAMKAIEAYRAAHKGANPPNEAAILPYFATPEEGADYAEFIETRKAAGL